MRFPHPGQRVVAPIGSSTEGLTNGACMPFPHPGQRVVAPQGAPPKALVAVSACLPHPVQRYVAP
eukprot:3415739-Pyramimonas_sp.AAC.1